MKSDEKDLPVSADYQKSQETRGIQVPDFLAQKTGALIGLGVVVLVVGLVALVQYFEAKQPSQKGNPLAARPQFETLRKHVESLAEVDGLCSKEDRTTCLCELADRIREDRRAIDAIIADDPALKSFEISVRRPASVTVSYDLAKLPTAPDEAACLNAVAAPTIIDDSPSGASAPASAVQAPADSPSAQ